MFEVWCQDFLCILSVLKVFLWEFDVEDKLCISTHALILNYQHSSYSLILFNLWTITLFRHQSNDINDSC